MSKQIVFSTKRIEELEADYQIGIQPVGKFSPYLKGNMGVRKGGIAFAMTKEEQDEYIKCAVDINYFAEKYCKIKLEDGSTNNMRLRDYQKEILDLFNNNRFSILLASRQIGKCFSHSSAIVICGENGKVVKKVPFFEYLFEINENKNIYDYIKYFLYKIKNYLK